MVSDRRVSDDGTKFRPSDKVFKNQDLLAGGVGNFLAIRKLRKAILAGARTPADLIPCVDEDSLILVVHKGRLWEVDEHGAEQIPEVYHSIGAGEDAALGYLQGRADSSLEACKEAVKFTFTRRTDCGDGIKVVKW